MTTAKRTLLIFSLGLLAGVLVSAAGFLLSRDSDQVSPPLSVPPADEHPRGMPARELESLERFLTMGDAELDQLEAAIARIRAMSGEERTAFADQILQYRKLPQEERRRMREGWGRQSEEDREDWHRMMRSLTPEERQEVHETLQEVPPDERTSRRLEMIEEWRQTERY